MFSVKNPSHPEFTFATESGVMALHFHPEHANLLAVGCYDGSVLVYDVHLKQVRCCVHAAAAEAAACANGFDSAGTAL